MGVNHIRYLKTTVLLKIKIHFYVRGERRGVIRYKTLPPLIALIKLKTSPKRQFWSLFRPKLTKNIALQTLTLKSNCYFKPKLAITYTHIFKLFNLKLFTFFMKEKNMS